VEIVYDETIVVPETELDRKIDLSADWQEACSSASVDEAYEDVDKIWRELLTCAKLSVFDTMTRGEGGITFIEKVIDAS
jgi:hypothetical protein